MEEGGGSSGDECWQGNSPPVQVTEEENRRHSSGPRRKLGDAVHGFRDRRRPTGWLRHFPHRLRHPRFHSLHAPANPLEAELLKDEGKPISTRRKQAARKREVKMEIKRLEKMVNCISNLKTAVKSMFAEVPNVEKISLVLGPSPLRPLHVYELCFVNIKVDAGDFSRSKVAELLSRKAIRTLISRGAGSDSYNGPAKLFLLVKAPSTLNMPLHFLPKREFKLNRKVIPFRLRFRGRALDLVRDAQPDGCADSGGLSNSASNDLIWFQCRHTIKGLACGVLSPEE
ncbi:uncharacterized protein [Primulina eburnea]|uniref:uncharacterized protein isoform X2 n=1 Tax=Primulina eburnea TaxID=1245227 RepID=UPI003C6C5814